MTPDFGKLLDTEQAAWMCGVKPVTIRQWVRRGHLTPAGKADGRLWFWPLDVARAEYATRQRARRPSHAA